MELVFLYKWSYGHYTSNKFVFLPVQVIIPVTPFSRPFIGVLSPHLYPVFCNAHLVGSFDPTSLPRPCFLPRFLRNRKFMPGKGGGGFVCDFCELGGRRLVVNMMDTKCKKYIYITIQLYLMIIYLYIHIYFF